MRLICSAIKEEIQYLSLLGQDIALALGIGYLEAAINLENYLLNNQEEKITEICFLGTAGSYKKNLELGELVQVKTSSLLNLGTILNHAYLAKSFADWQLVENTNLDLKKVHCLSSLEITTNYETSKKISGKYKSDFLVENMELYGVAQIAQKHQIECSSILAITNYTDAQAHENWQKNQEKCSWKLGAVNKSR